MILAVVGSRNFKNKNIIFNKLDEINSKEKISMIISGEAIGVDSIAKEWSLKTNIKYEGVFPMWDIPSKGVPMKKNKYGKLYNPIAGILRNSIIVDKCDKLIAFWDGKSSGTKDSIKKALSKNKIYEIVYI